MTQLNSFLAGLIFLTILSTASATTCKAQLVPTLCGSGKVEITFDSKQNKFSIYNGDVGCWFGDFELQGRLIKTKSHYQYLSVDSYILKIQDNDVLYAKLIYDPALSLARLEIIEDESRNDNGRMSSKYDLICD